MSGFVSGARVAIVSGGIEHHYREDFVLKVHKNGNFTLKGNPQQQYRPWSDGKTARRTGDTGYYSSSVKVWDDEADAEIKVAIAIKNRRRRIRLLSDKFRSMSPEDMTDAMLDQIEATFPK